MPTFTYSTVPIVWTAWTTATNATSVATTPTDWYDWNQTTNQVLPIQHTNITATAAIVWTNWNNDYVILPQQTPPVLTEEERRQQEEALKRQAAEFARQRDEWEKKAREEESKRLAAEQRARELLELYLNTEQAERFRKDKVFEVQAPSGKRYRLKEGWAGNVCELNKDGKPVRRFCIHPRQTVPYADNLLAQKLLLETDEKEFLRIANRTELAVN